VQSKFVKLILACLICAGVITLVVLLAKRLSGR
jgi:Flp pilus assembly protein protease CpaA